MTSLDAPGLGSRRCAIDGRLMPWERVTSHNFFAADVVAYCADHDAEVATMTHEERQRWLMRNT